MTKASTHNHDLEDHIEELRKLDDLRKKSGQFRDEGIEVLKAHKNDLLRSQDRIFDVALAIRALSIKLNLPDKKKKKQEELLKTIFDLGKDLQTCTLDDIVRDKHSVLAAARVLRALVACPGGAFSRTAMVCYYWITREIYIAEGSDWSTGGVRAAPDGSVSAFVTSECVHALMSFAEAQRKTANFVEEVSKFLKRMEHLNQIEKNLNQLDELKSWIDAEKKRLRLSLSLSLQRLSQHLVLPIPDFISSNENPPGRNDPNQFSFDNYISNFFPPNKIKIEELDTFAGEFLKKDLKKKLADVQKNFAEAKEQIKVYRENEESSGNERAFKKSETAHEIARHAIDIAMEHVNKAIGDNDVNKTDSQSGFEDFQKELNKAAEQVTYLLRPAMNYLGTVLDRELATVSLNEQWDWQPAELACAATAYGRLSCLPGKWSQDVRFGRAIDQLSKAISRCGLVPNKRAYHTMRYENSYYYFSNSVALTALAHLLRNLTEPELESGLIDKMLRFFDEIKAAKPYDDWQFSKEEIQKIERNEEEFKNDGDNYVIKHYVPILKKYLNNSALASKYEEMFYLPKSIANEKKITGSLWEILATLLNQILQDEEIYQNYTFPNDDGKYKDHKAEIEKLKKDLLKKQDSNKDLPKKKDRDKLIHLSRLILENDYTENTEIEKLIKDLSKKQDTDKDLPKKKDRDKLIRLNRLILEVDFKGIISESGAVKFSSNKPKTMGWCRDHSPLIPKKTDLASTAHAVFALAEINEMLDTRINYMILDHFSVKEKNKGLDKDLKLDSLFYPDYGLEMAPCEEQFETKCPGWIEEKDWPTKGIKRKQCIALTLQQIHAHVSRGVLPDEFKPTCSLVLHGPAGTGKTTLLEALALTCDVPLVEVTPSDLVKRGEENIEQRARAVFYALSLLTRAIVLFDEFDPVLKRRDVSNNNPLNVFSFLTPGMLPKLKDLHDCAKKRSVAYILVTNLIGELDEAAVRQGRFDERLGIYPPDLLSRTGRFMDQIYSDIFNKDTSECNEALQKCIVHIIKRTEGKGMTALGKPGWFTIPNEQEKRDELKEETSLYGLFHLKKDNSSEYDDELKKFNWPEPDDMLKGILGMGRTAVEECLQWQWVNEWDSRLRQNDSSFDALNEALKAAKHLTKLSQPEYAQSSRSGRRRGD